MATTSAWGVELVLREKLLPTSPVIRLGDVADIHTNDGKLARQLAMTQLWPAPQQGKQRFESARSINDILARRGFDTKSITFRGAKRITIGYLTTEPSATKTPVSERPSVPTFPIRDEFNRNGASSGFRTLLVGDEPTRNRPKFLSEDQRNVLVDQVCEAVKIGRAHV